MKKVMFLILVLALIFGVGSGTIFAETNGVSLDASADVYAEVLEAFDVTNLEDLDFGTLAASADAGGTITVSPDGTSSTSGIPYHDGAVNAAEFEITGGFSGDSGIDYSVDLPTSVTITNESDESMTVDNFISNLTDNSGTMNSSSEEFAVGATLNVGAAQEAGDYTGSFEVTVTLE